MAFYLWAEINTNVLNASAFSNDSQRINGFKAGDVASANHVNSALRQANLVACALMDALGITDEDLGSAREDVAIKILAGLNGGRSNITGDYMPNTTNLYNLGDSDHRWLNGFITSLGVRELYAESTIRGATDIISNNGNIEAVHGDVRDSVGTLNVVRDNVSRHTNEIAEINTRLEALGFSQESVAVAGIGSEFVVKRQGNYVIGYLSKGQHNMSADMLRDYFGEGKTILTLPANYRPATQLDYVPFVLGQGGNYAVRVVRIQTDGKCIVTSRFGGDSISTGTGNVWWYFSFGFEAPART